MAFSRILSERRVSERRAPGRAGPEQGLSETEDPFGVEKPLERLESRHGKMMGYFWKDTGRMTGYFWKNDGLFLLGIVVDVDCDVCGVSVYWWSDRV